MEEQNQASLESRQGLDLLKLVGPGNELGFIYLAVKQHDPISALERSYQLAAVWRLDWRGRRGLTEAVVAIHGGVDSGVNRAVIGGEEKWADSRSIL